MDLFNIHLTNPLKTWRKAKMYFKKPKIEIHFFSNIHKNCPFISYNYIAKILHIESEDVMWKSKWNEPRHERDPFIWICLFKTFGFSINFKIYYLDENNKKQDGGSYYWEYLLDYLYFRKDLNKINIWTNCFTKNIIPTPIFSLNKKGLKQLSQKTLDKLC